MLNVGLRLTKTVVQQLPFCKTGQVIYWDSALTGFGVRVGRESKTYIAEGRVKGRTCRVKLGKHDLLVPEVARSMAREQLLLMTKGVKPREKQRQDSVQSVTLQALFDDYLKTKRLKPVTLKDYRRVIEGELANRLQRPFMTITKDMVAKRHTDIVSMVTDLDGIWC